ncbi:Titin-like protein [Frankliniella fusca]|uniref:Titin-like protein n=1 Tax=Frankliniella fusca TaxID=407009 RepID=A0AAE1I190_9NEOP|nr:Titin-like protein [Frankliniella fusca]KAK3922999.1 Titin-like protein [Frankliniella fusca]KAK3926845.1 Titin-like protein [Frankliniella fusca]KAK3927937.1 Titin-like protein [Frankliniella fusca]KAK3931662.1 Titin-like protein [Frankliniella fusca]
MDSRLKWQVGKRKWLSEGRPVPRSTLYYREKYRKKKGGAVSIDNCSQPSPAQADPSGEQQEENSQTFSGNASEPAPDTSLLQHVELPSHASDTSHDSTGEEVEPLVAPTLAKRRARRRKIVVRENVDSDDALSSSSVSSDSEPMSSRENCSPELASPDPPTDYQQKPTNQFSAVFDEFEVLEQENQQVRPPDLPNQREPLCPCTNITAEEVMFMTLTLGVRHGLTWVAQVDILRIIASIFKNSSIPTTKHQYKEKLKVKDDKDISYHVFCCECDSYIGKKGKNTKIKYCQNCKKNIKVKSNQNCFVSLSIESQLQKFMRDESFVSNIMTYRFKQPSKAGVFSDIYDGNVYKSLSAEGGILSSPYNFSVTFFTDGVAFGKSSNKTIWPIYLTVNELPYHIRCQYLVLAGVYAGSHDPNQLYFLKPFVDAMNFLSSNGMKWIHDGVQVTSLVLPLCCVVDSVARYQILNYKHFGGDYGCTFCYRRSQYVLKTGSRYPITEEPAEARTEESYWVDIHSVQAKPNTIDRAHRGVKGTCNLFSLKYFSIFHSLVVDYMHNVLLGVTKRHTDLIFQASYKKMWIDVRENNIGVGTLKAIIDDRIDSFQSSTGIIRDLRGISHLGLWRASEWRLWLLFYFVTCLKGLLKEKYLLHFALLSKAINLLLKRSVSEAEITLAHRMLMCYSYYFQKYFGEANMVYNIHLLSHIGQCVYNFGPIWGHSSFPFESANRHLLQLCKNPNSVALEISRKFVVFQSLPSLTLTLNCSDIVINFSESILNYRKLNKCHRAANNKCILLGMPHCQAIPSTSRQLVGSTSENCFVYERMIYKNNRFTTVQYSKELNTNDSFVYLKSGACVAIHKIIKIPDGNRVMCLVQTVVSETNCLLQNSVVKYDCIAKVLKFDGYYFVRLEEIEEPCLFIDIKGAKYVARIPYGCTVE